MNVLYILIGFSLLVIGGDFLVKSSVGLSLKINISKMVIGMTVVSFATSMPELLVSLQAALEGSAAIAINNVIGSNIANIGLVLGITAFIKPIVVNRDFYRLNWPIMMLFSILIYYFLWNDYELTYNEGVILLILLISFLILLIKRAKKEGLNNDEIDDSLKKISSGKIILWLIIGTIALYFGSKLLVNGAKELAINIGVTEGVISVTMIAVGTSVPELAASIVAILKGEKAISLGNLIGSNIFNIASVLGLTAIIKKIPVTEPQILTRDIYWMLAFAFVLLPLAFIPKKYKISKYKGLLLFLGYLVFIFITFINRLS